MTKDQCEALRREIEAVADRVWGLRQPSPLAQVPAEAIANVTLAYRHLENAAMRLDKATKTLNRTQVPGA